MTSDLLASSDTHTELECRPSAAARWGELLARYVPPLVALALVASQLLRPGQLLGAFAYDDGVYFAAADRLVHGIVPYRDFVLVHPPGIALLMAPIALLGRAIGTDDALGIARVLTDGVAVANVVLVGRILHDRGTIACFCAAMALSCFPLAVAADNTLLLEPYVALFCLLALRSWRRRGRRPQRAELYAGMLVGVACAIKIDAAVVLGALVVVSLQRGPRRAGAVLFGAAVTIGVICVPFFAMAPTRFLHEVVVSQIARGSNGASSLSLATRLSALSGAAGISFAKIGNGAVVGVAIGVVIGVVALFFLRRRELDDLAWLAVFGAGATATAMLCTPAFYAYYTYLPVTLFALVIGVVVHELSRIFPKPKSARVKCVLAFIAVAVSILAIEQAVSFSAAFVSADRQSAARAVISAMVPVGSCVVFDEASLAIAADRLDASSSNCPKIVDPFGTWLSDAPSDPPPSSFDPPRLVASWRRWLSKSDYLVEVAPNSDFIPWSATLTRWFAQHYRLVGEGENVYVFAHAKP